MFRADGFQLLSLLSMTLPPASRTNCIIAGHDEAYIVDPGSPFRAEQERLLERLYELRGNGAGITGVLLTHHHGDHTGGALPLCARLKIPLFAHPETLNRLDSPSSGLDTRSLQEGQQLAINPGLSLEVLHTPGHAPGHLCFWEAGQRVLICGDMVLGSGGTSVIDPGEGDMSLYLASLERLGDLAPRVILPGHGPVIDDGKQAIKRLITHRKWREWKLLMALEPHPRALMDLTREAYVDLPSPLALPLAARSALAHLIKLEKEGKARRAGGHRWVQVGEPRRGSARSGP